MSASGNGASGRMLDLMQHALAKLDDVVHEQRSTNVILARMDGRVESIEGRLESMDGRLESMDGRLESVEGRLESVEGRLESVEGRLESMDGRLESVERGLAAVREDLHDHTERLESAILADRSIRLRLTALEGWAVGQGYRPE